MSVGNHIMSTGKTTPQETRARLVKGSFADHGEAANEASAAEVEVTSLQIDETYDGDCDPYNCTGQFLVEALKQKRDE